MKDRVEEIVLSELDPNFKISCLIRKSNRARRINLRIRSREKQSLPFLVGLRIEKGCPFSLIKKNGWNKKSKPFRLLKN